MTESLTATGALAAYLDSLGGTVADPFSLRRCRELILAMPEEQQAIATVAVAECTTDYASLSTMTMLLMDVIHNCEDADAYWVGFDMMCCVVTRPFIANDPSFQAEADFAYKYSYDLCFDIIKTGLEALDDPAICFASALALIDDCYDQQVACLLPDITGIIQNIITDMPPEGQIAARAMLAEALIACAHDVFDGIPQKMMPVQNARSANDVAFMPPLTP
ncbi:MAG: hypothetical protein V4621_04595 [Pseudomonadota bacterium]